MSFFFSNLKLILKGLKMLSWEATMSKTYLPPFWKKKAPWRANIFLLEKTSFLIVLHVQENRKWKNCFLYINVSKIYWEYHIPLSWLEFFFFFLCTFNQSINLIRLIFFLNSKSFNNLIYSYVWSIKKSTLLQQMIMFSPHCDWLSYHTVIKMINGTLSLYYYRVFIFFQMFI